MIGIRFSRLNRLPHPVNGEANHPRGEPTTALRHLSRDLIC